MGMNVDQSKANYALDQRLGVSDDALGASLGGFIFQGGGGSIAKAMDAAELDQESNSQPMLLAIGGAAILLLLAIVFFKR